MAAIQRMIVVSFPEAPVGELLRMAVMLQTIMAVALLRGTSAGLRLKQKQGLAPVSCISRKEVTI